MHSLLSRSSRRVVVLAALLGAGSAFAGECFCKSETFTQLLIKKATKEELSACEKDAPEQDGKPYKVNEDDALRCLSGSRYQYVESGEMTAESYRSIMVMEAATHSLEAELNPQQLTLLSAKQLRLLRNVVYARHGRPFDSKDLKEYFSIRSWYRADPAYTDARLTPLDQRNLELIQKAEKTAR